jgi:hypothetical protein
MLDKFLFDIFKSSIVGAITFLGVILLNSFGVFFLWNWFVAPIIVSITLIQATGIVLLLSCLGFFQSPSYKSTDQKERNKQDWAKFFAEIAKVALYLLLGFGLNYIAR